MSHSDRLRCFQIQIGICKEKNKVNRTNLNSERVRLIKIDNGCHFVFNPSLSSQRQLFLCFFLQLAMLKK